MTSTTPTWHPHPTITDYDCEVLATEADYAGNRFIAMIEDFGSSDVAYPCAVNAKTGDLERGGPMRPDRAKAWAERVAGLHPTKPGDERAPFYYSGEERS